MQRWRCRFSGADPVWRGQDCVGQTFGRPQSRRSCRISQECSPVETGVSIVRVRVMLLYCVRVSVRSVIATGRAPYPEQSAGRFECMQLPHQSCLHTAPEHVTLAIAGARKSAIHPIAPAEIPAVATPEAPRHGCKQGQQPLARSLAFCGGACPREHAAGRAGKSERAISLFERCSSLWKQRWTAKVQRTREGRKEKFTHRSRRSRPLAIFAAFSAASLVGAVSIAHHTLYLPHPLFPRCTPSISPLGGRAGLHDPPYGSSFTQ